MEMCVIFDDRMTELTFAFTFPLIANSSWKSLKHQLSFLLFLVTAVINHASSKQSFLNADWYIQTYYCRLIDLYVYVTCADETLRPFCYNISTDSEATAQIFICTSSNTTRAAGARRLWASLLQWSIVILDACGACSSEHKSTSINALINTLSLLLE